VLRVGEIAPAWTGTAATGETLTLESFRGRPLVLYFYPKAGTTGCSIEARGFAEHYPEFQRAGVAVIGVSVDRIDAQKRFSDDCHLPFPLIADDHAAIARAYGVLGLLGIAKRVTFWIDAEGRVTDVIQGMLPGPHLRGALQRLASVPSGATSPDPATAGAPPGPK